MCVHGRRNPYGVELEELDARQEEVFMATVTADCEFNQTVSLIAWVFAGTVHCAAPTS
jgi:hypothetical protein